VGCPSPLISEPGGSGLPPVAATRTLPSATLAVAKSRINGSLSPSGTPIVTGLVDIRLDTPPKGATSRLPATLTKWIEISPDSIAISAQSPILPRCPDCRNATIDIPLLRALLIPSCTACSPIVCPNPRLPSTTVNTSVSLS